MQTIQIMNREYELVDNHKDGWNAEAFQKRYSSVLNKYDYIFGDWGYGQLRLKGFFPDEHTQATAESKISYLEEYINEFCNFGCPYFLLRRIKEDL